MHLQKINFARGNNIRCYILERAGYNRDCISKTPGSKPSGYQAYNRGNVKCCSKAIGFTSGVRNGERNICWMIIRHCMLVIKSSLVNKWTNGVRNQNSGNGWDSIDVKIALQDPIPKKWIL